MNEGLTSYSIKLCLLMSFYLVISIHDNIFIYETGNITMIHEKRLFLELMMFVILSPPFYRDQIKLPYHNWTSVQKSWKNNFFVVLYFHRLLIVHPYTLTNFYQSSKPISINPWWLFFYLFFQIEQLKVKTGTKWQCIFSNQNLLSIINILMAFPITFLKDDFLGKATYTKIQSKG